MSLATPDLDVDLAELIDSAFGLTVRLFEHRDGRPTRAQSNPTAEIQAPWYEARRSLPAEWTVSGPGRWFICRAEVVDSSGEVIYCQRAHAYVEAGDVIQVCE